MTTAKKRWTWPEIWAFLGKKFDIADEDLIDEDFAMDLFNNAIDDAEAIIQAEFPEYFLTHQDPEAFEDGTDAIDCPENLYGNKIRKIILNNGSQAYECTRMTNLDKFLDYRLSRVQSDTTEDEDRVYFLANESESGPRILISPPPVGTSWSYEIWYYRQSNRIEDDEDVCDIPEAMNYLWAHFGEQVEDKRRKGSVAHATAITTKASEDEKLREIITTLMQDQDNPISADLSFYKEMV